MRARAMVALVLATGCADDLGPLHPDTIAELTRSKGDAHGYGHTAIYDATLLPDECDCPAVTVPNGMTGGGSLGSLCILQLVSQAFVTVEVVQNDGTMLLRFELFEMVGPIDADDTFSIGAYDGLSAFEAGHRTARLDGHFEDDDFFGDFAQHYDGETLDQSFDCRESFGVEAIRRP